MGRAASFVLCALVVCWCALAVDIETAGNLHRLEEGACQELSSPNGRFESNKVGTTYKNNLNQCWTIKGAKITVTFTRFDVEAGYDTVKFYDAQNSLLGEAKDKSATVTAMNQITIRFITDSSVTRAGFEASWSTVTGGGGSGGASAATGVALNLDANHKTCNTFRYRSDGRLIVRRACTFVIGVVGAKPTALTFETAQRDQAANKFNCNIGGSGSAPGFTCTLTGNNVQVKLEASVPIGEYALTATLDNGSTIRADKTVIVLFNPYNKDDEVFCEVGADDWKKCEVAEAVENESGKIWVGNVDQNRGWNYDQFSIQNLVASLRLLSPLPVMSRASAITVSRFLTHAVSDEALEGNWSGDYSGGKEPWVWTSSSEILAVYLQTNQVVKYGQCWVFAGLLNTLLRTVGIPARVSTNFNSAHEHKPFDQTIDEYYTTKGGSLVRDGRGHDSVWNFHVWNEAFLRRSDIPGGQYDGWQAVDATPQELSDNLYQTGPASLRGMYEKKLKDPTISKYDAPFITSEVDADVQRWINGKKSTLDKRRVGTALMSFHPTKPNGEDRSPLYKKETTSTFFMFTSLRGEEVRATIILPTQAVRAGNPVPIRVALSSSIKGRMQYFLSAQAIQYNDQNPVEFDVAKGEAQLDSAKETVIRFVCDPAKYNSYLKSTHTLNILFFGTVVETRQNVVTRQLVNLAVPKLLLLGPRNIKLGNHISVNVFFDNPLPTPLTGVSVTATVTGSGIQQEFTLLPNVEWRATGSTHLGSIKTRSVMTGSVLMVATLKCNELADVFGEVGFLVE